MTPEERREYRARRDGKQFLTDKVAGYGEGIIHGWEAAAAQVAEATNGLFTLNEPREVTEWRARLKRSK